MNRLSPLCVGLLALAVLSSACSRDSEPLPAAPDSPAALLEARPNVRSVVVVTEELDIGPDGIAEYASSTTTGYDAHGNRVSEVYVSGGDRYSTVAEFNVYGDLIAYISDEDEGSDGTIDDRWIGSTIEVDQQGHPTRLGVDYDEGADGTVDDHNEYAYQYDARGNVIAGSSENATSSYEYDVHGNVVHFVNQTTALPVTRLNQTSEYSVHDALLHEVLSITQGAHRPSVHTLETTEVDGQGYPTLQRLSLADGNRVINRSIVSTTYDGHHRPLVQVQNEDGDANGTVDARATARFDYFGPDVVAVHGKPARPGLKLGAGEARQTGFRDLLAGAQLRQ